MYLSQIIADLNEILRKGGDVEIKQISVKYQQSATSQKMETIGIDDEFNCISLDESITKKPSLVFRHSPVAETIKQEIVNLLSHTEYLAANYFASVERIVTDKNEYAFDKAIELGLLENHDGTCSVTPAGRRFIESVEGKPSVTKDDIPF